MDLNNVILISISATFAYMFTNLAIESVATSCSGCLSRKKKFCKWYSINYHTLIAWIQGAEVILLKDRRDRIHITLAYKNETGDGYYGHTNYVTKTGNLVFNEDGTVENASGLPSHVKYWLPLDQEKRIWMVLQGAQNFEF